MFKFSIGSDLLDAFFLMKMYECNATFVVNVSFFKVNISKRGKVVNDRCDGLDLNRISSKDPSRNIVVIDFFKHGGFNYER